MTAAVKRVLASSAGEATGRLVNVALPFAVLYLHGAGLASDGFFLVMAFVFFVQGTTANALATALVPVLARRQQRFELFGYCWRAGCFALLMALLTVVFSPGYFSPQEQLLVFVAAGAAGASGLIAAPAVAALGVEHRYAAAGLTWGLRALPLLAYLLWAPEDGRLTALLVGIALADAGRCALLIRLAKRRLTWQRGQPLPFPVEAGYLLAASLIAGAVPLVVRWMASLGEAGAVSIFELADRVFAAIVSLGTLGIGNVALVYFAHAGTSVERGRLLRRMLKAGLAWSMLWVVVIVGGALFLPALVGRFGAVEQVELERIAAVLLILALALPAFVLHMLLSRGVIASGRAKALPLLALVGLLTTASVGWFSSESLGVQGLAVGVVAGQYVVFAMMLGVFLRLEEK